MTEQVLSLWRNSCYCYAKRSCHQTSKYLCLYINAQFWFTLNPGHSNFFLPWAVANEEIDKWLWALSHTWDVYYQLLCPQGSGSFVGRETERMLRTRGLGGVLWNSVFFWTVCGYWLMNSQQLWLSTRDPHVLKFQHGRGKGSGGLRPRLRSCWQLMSTGDNTVIFLWGWTTSRLYTPQLWHHNQAHMGSSNWNQ